MINTNQEKQGEINLRNLFTNKKLVIFIIIIIIVCVFLGMFKDKILKIIYPQNYKEIVSIYAEKYGVEENLIYAVIKAESNFNNNAVSHKGAIGIMQIMEDTGEEIATKLGLELDKENLREELSKIDNNINIGTNYLSVLLEKYKNKEVALAAYNAGIGTVDNWIEKGIIKGDGTNIENIPYKETNNYVRKILRDYKIYCYLY